MNQQTCWTYWSTIIIFFIPSVKLQDGEAGRNLYSARYDNLNIDTILNSNRLVTNYVDCLLNKKACPPEGKDLKRILPEALRTKCSKCSSRQKENALKVIRKLYEDYPQHYSALREKWDPSGEYHRRFLEYLADEQYNQIGSNDYNRDQSQINTQTLKPALVVTRKVSTTTTTVRPLTTRATRSPAFEPAGSSVQEVVPQASFNSPSTSVLPLFNIFGEVTKPNDKSPSGTILTTTLSSARGDSDPDSSISNISITTLSTDVVQFTSPLSVFDTTTSSTTEMRRPTYISSSTLGSGVAVGNRFGGEEFDSSSVTAGQASTFTTRQPQRNRPPTTIVTTTTTTRWPLFPNLFQPPQPNGPIAQVINHFGNKISRTSEVIADMIHNTARLINSVVQPQPPPPNYVN